ncbi:MAG: 30S ribosomal protein S18 [Candidatus Omnitrophica bacterium]|nr:30S ribosomal protein S18 [Candidatus Omnitrophota bacterium]
MPFRFQVTPDVEFDYKNIPLISKFLNDRGKMLPRRITGVTAKQQRNLSTSIKRARFLALLPSGSAR